MFKKMTLTLFLALQLAAVANLANAEIPFPQCWPCPDAPPAATR